MRSFGFILGGVRFRTIGLISARLTIFETLEMFKPVHKHFLSEHCRNKGNRSAHEDVGHIVRSDKDTAYRHDCSISYRADVKKRFYPRLIQLVKEIGPNWDEIAKHGSDSITMTHEQIARYMGSAREVVSRMIKYFVAEGIIETSRGGIKVIDRSKLKALAF